MSWSDPAYEHVAQIIGARTGLSFAPNRCADAEAGIRRVMARRAIPEASRYLALLEAGAVPLDDLVAELTVGETYFFREPAHFDFIRHEVLQQVRHRRDSSYLLRVWSAGCATGEEAYSLAMMLDEAGVNGHILATDISRAALHKAREATYGPWSLRGVHDALVRRFFHNTGDRWTVDPGIRQRVTFEFHNLAQSAYPPIAAGIWGMDVILCRNVLIYFDKAAVSRVAQGLYDSLADEGWLITGPSDPPLDGLAPFTTVVTDAGVLYRRSNSPRHVPALGVEASIEARVVVPVERRSFETLDREELQPAGEMPCEPAPDPMFEVQQAFDGGHYNRVLALTNEVRDEAGAILRVRAMANGHGSAQAAREAQRWIQRYPLCTEIHLLHAVLLIDAGQDEEAARALRRALYLDRSLAIANFLLGSVLRRQGKREEAWRAYRNARDLARARSPEDPLPLADGERAGGLAVIAEAEVALLDPPLEVSR